VKILKKHKKNLQKLSKNQLPLPLPLKFWYHSKALLSAVILTFKNPIGSQDSPPKRALKLPQYLCPEPPPDPLDGLRELVQLRRRGVARKVREQLGIFKGFLRDFEGIFDDFYVFF
jgi:hypothetical protein